MTACSSTPPGHFGPCPPHFGRVPLAVSAIFLRDPVRIWCGCFSPTGWSRKEEGGVARLAVETYSSTERGSGMRTRTTWRREAHGYRHVSSSSRRCRASLVHAPARVLVTASRAPSRPPAPTRARCSYGLEQHRRSPSRCRARRRSAAQRGAKPERDRRIAAARQDQSKQAGICERHFFFTVTIIT